MVAAECDLELPTGRMQVSAGYAALLEHDFGGSARCRVVVAGRDEAFADSASREQHRITVWPSARPAGRWRSRLLDRTGAELEQISEHADR